ncbi:DUF4160 domain-containing protein [Meiothermus sp. QL-1]|uniref:DUF4160 domain-containing protein n=1 Tax=Meiothermus sp. QL-1 TaxID=2058095 RepID=UPI000E0AED55|nr:DUF4160 domain-containing protein [Meiothermus sp. QL-1]RDI96344.1 DUF4160 domain-containing protein [Meiothermus sp. QL-1]
MLTLLRRAGFRFYVKSGSAQERPHVYVGRDHEAWAKFTLSPVGLVVNNGLPRNELNRVQGMVMELEPQLLQLWWDYAKTQGVKPPEEERRAPKAAETPAEPEDDPGLHRG